MKRTALLALLVSALTLGQSSTVLRIDVNLVQVDAVVTDSRNRHIGNLKAGDFEVLQDGKPQKITNFSYITSATPPPRDKVSTTGPAMLAAPSAPSTLTAAQVRRMVALVVDDLGLSVEGIARVRDALRKFVSREMRPGDMVAVIRTSAGMGVLQQFTTDRTVLNAAINQIRFTLGRVGVSSFAPDDAQSPEEKKVAAAERVLDQFRSGTLMAGTLGTLRYVIDGLRDMPGRKSVVLFSESLPLLDVGLRGLTDAANRASVVINTIDPRGLQTFSDVRDYGRGAPARKQRESDMLDSSQGLAALAQATGGLFVSNNNLIGEALDEVVADTDGYYLIGYHPDPATFDSKNGEPMYHKVQVRLKTAGFHVRSRSGFFGESDTAPDVAVNGRASLRGALTSPFFSSGVHVQLTALFNQTPDKRSNLTALLHIDAHDLSFTLLPDGSRHAGFQVATETFGVNGEQVDQSDRSFKMDLKPDQYAVALARGVVYVVNQPIRAPGMYQMRVALRDESSERVGAANQFVDVPDLTRGRLTLSSILLRHEERGAPSEMNHSEGQMAEDDPATVAAVRVFKPGDALSYQYLIFNAQSGAAKKADLEVRTRLFRDGKQIYAGQAMVPALAGEVDSGRLLAGGHMTLANEISPGDYELQIIVTDELAKQKYQTTSQWIDFEVAQ